MSDLFLRSEWFCYRRRCGRREEKERRGRDAPLFVHWRLVSFADLVLEVIEWERRGENVAILVLSRYLIRKRVIELDIRKRILELESTPFNLASLVRSSIDSFFSHASLRFWFENQDKQGDTLSFSRFQVHV